MTSYPTDLSEAEGERARERLDALADRFTEDGDLRTAEWRETFLSTWRHPYVPAYYPSLDKPPVLCIGDPAGLDAVYSDKTLVTKVAPIPLSRAFRPARGWMYTSSSTLPSLVLRMLETLDVRDGHRVLEIGTGSGYNCVPTAWLKQAAPDAVIITDVHGLLGGTLVRLTVDTEGTAIGRFVPYWSGFMQMRRAVEPEMPDRHRWGADEPSRSSTDVDPAPLRAHGLFGFVVQWHLPDVSRGFGTSDDGQPALHLFAPDGSEAFIETEKTHGRYRVSQAGPRRLWDIVEEIHEFWQNAGQPRYDRFGLTATAAEQYVWLDDSDSPHRWPLPVR